MYEKIMTVNAEKLRGRAFGCSRFETRKVIVRDMKGKNCETVIAMFYYDKNSELLQNIDFRELDLSDEVSMELLHFAKPYLGAKSENDLYKKEACRLYCVVRDKGNTYHGILKCSRYETYKPDRKDMPYYVPAPDAKLEFFWLEYLEAELLREDSMNLTEHPMLQDYSWCQCGKEYYQVYTKNTGYISHDDNDDLAIGFDDPGKKRYLELKTEELENRVLRETYELGELVNPEGRAYRWKARIDGVKIIDHRIYGREYVDPRIYKPNECQMFFKLSIPEEEAVFCAGKRSRRIYRFADFLQIDISDFLRRVDEENVTSQKKWLRSAMMLRARHLWEGKEVEVFGFFGKKVFGSGEQHYLKGNIFIPEICKAPQRHMEGLILAGTVKLSLKEMCE